MDSQRTPVLAVMQPRRRGNIGRALKHAGLGRVAGVQ